MSWLKTKDPRIKKIGDVYYARFSKRGIRVEDSLYTKDYKLAVDLVERIERAILTNQDYKAVLIGEDDSLTPLIEDLYPMFLEDISKGNQKKGIKKLREKTIKECSNFYERCYGEFFGTKHLEEVDEDEWEAFLMWCRENSKRGPKLKLFNHWKYFSAFLTWAVKTGRIDKKPNIYNPDPITFEEENEEKDGYGINYTDEELKAFRDGSAYHSGFHLWILCGQYMGMRTSEVTQLKKDRLDLKKNMINLRAADTKTRTARAVPIHPAVLPHLLAQVEKTKDRPYLYPNRNDHERPMDPTGFKKHFEKLRDSINHDGVYHFFRHSYATRVFGDPKVNPVLACKALGMSMKTAMKHYIHFTDDQLSALNSFSLGNE